MAGEGISKLGWTIVFSEVLDSLKFQLFEHQDYIKNQIFQMYVNLEILIKSDNFKKHA